MLPILVLVGVAILAQGWAPRAGPLVTVYRTAHCHCCVRWVRHLERSGFTIETRLTQSLAEVRGRFGIAPALASCHTAAATGIAVDTIRFYERLGLIETAPRQGGEHRLYRPEAIDCSAGSPCR